MRTMYVCIMLLFLTVSVKAQSSDKGYKFQANQVAPLINEVYKDQAETIVFSDAIRYEGFKKLLLERVIVYKQNFKKGETYPNLTDAPLLKTYNQALTRDYVYNSSTFNPLKYDISLFSNELVVYRIDKQHIVMIQPQNSLKN